MSKLRILLAIDDATIGGGQMHVLLLAKYLRGDRFDVELATATTGWLVDEARKLDFKVHHLELNNRLNWRSFDRARQLLTREKFDLVHTHGGTAGFWLRLAALRSDGQIVLIHTYHGLHYLNQSRQGFNAISEWVKRQIFQNIDRLLLPHTDRIICVCQSDYRQAIAAGLADPERASVVYNGIEIDRFSACGDRQQARQLLNIEADSFVFGNVGRLHAQKGQEFLLLAFAKLADRARLMIVGNGELRAQLTLLAAKLQIEDRVDFLGARADVCEILAAIDVFVLPSLWEGQPISLLEALAMGKPCIASDVDGIPEIISNGVNGYLVTPRDVESLAAAMQLAIERPELLQSPTRWRSLSGGESAPSQLPRQFWAAQMATEIAKIYRSVLTAEI